MRFGRLSVETRALAPALFPVALGFGIYAEWAALRRGPLEQRVTPAEVRLAIADFIVGLVFVACGVVASTRRPYGRIGVLLVLAGLAWFLGTFSASGDPGYAGFGILFVTLHRGPLAHALLSYPSGRLDRWSDRAAVAVAYAVSAIADLGETTWGGLIVAFIVVTVGAHRFLRSVGPQQRARMVAAVASAAFAASLVVAAVTRLSSSSASVDRGVLWAYQVVVVAIAIALTLDLMLGRWVAAAVTRLIVDLGEAAETGTLRDRLAGALGDRSLAFGFWLPERGVYVDERGRELELSEMRNDRLATVVQDGDEPVAVLVHDREAQASRDLLQSVTAAARLAVGNARLHAAVVRQVEELEVSRRRVVDAAEAERLHLERELREGAERRLVEIQALLEEAERRADGGFAATLAEVKAKLARTRAELVEFARGIHPRAISERGLGAALAELAERTTTPVELRVSGGRYPPSIEAAVYFVCSEALANVDKHANASSASVELKEKNGLLVMTVADKGEGGASSERGSGLRGLADRVEALGGELTVTSLPGVGTSIAAEIPLG